MNEPPKEKWGDGPWQSEPDLVEFEHAGFKCFLKRTMHLGAWCGYVAVPPGHPWEGQRYDDVEADVHGGLTFSAAQEGLWWLGFDCAHLNDFMPAVAALLGRDARAYEHYRTIDYARAETMRLAEQARAAADVR